MTDQESGIYHPNENDETCGVYLGAGFILGGNVTKRGELPYQAALGYRGKKGKGNSYNCGGTLINRYVIGAVNKLNVVSVGVGGLWGLGGVDIMPGPQKTIYLVQEAKHL